MADTKIETTAKEKKVKLTIPMTRTEKEDVFVGVNGRRWQIKRGIEVEVPACVAEVLRHREEMLTQAMAYEESRKSKD